MTQSEQMQLVLLFAMCEMGGGGRRSEVLQHIQDHGYWYKNDWNDAPGPARPSEMKWRNFFSYERQHLVAAGEMQAGGDGNWLLTEAGAAQLGRLSEQARAMPAGETRIFTLALFQKLFAVQSADAAPEEAAYLARLAAEDLDAPPTALSDAPEVKRAARRTGSRTVYPRDVAVAQRALARAGHRCEADPTHPTFLRRSGRTPYTEPHHLIPLSFTDYFGVNLDREQNIVSLCSHCHNQIHYGTREDVRALLAQLFRPRSEAIRAILGREIDLEALYRIYDVL